MFLELDLKRQGAQLRFPEEAEFRGWLKKEREHWLWLEDTKLNNEQFNTIRGNYFQPFLKVESLLERMKAPGADQSGLLENIRTRLVEAYSSGRLVYSASAEGDYLSKLSDKDPVRAVFALGWLTKHHLPNLTDRVQVESLLDAELFLRGVEQRADAEIVALSNSKYAWSSALADVHAELAAAKETAAEVGRSLRELREEEARKFRSLFEEFAIKHQDEINTAESNRVSLTDTFREHMALREPVRYWKVRRTTAFIVAGVTGVAVIVTGLSSAVYANNVLRSLWDNPKPPLARLAYIVFVVTLGVWLIRLLVRWLLSNLHTATEASERAVLIQTYLALLADGSITKSDENHRLMLSAVFKNMGSGLGSDDAAPPSLTGFLSRVAGGR